MGILDVNLKDAAAGVVTLVNRFFPDATEEEKAKIANVMQLAQNQADINKIEAASEDAFTSRWRPFIGWVCGVSLAYTYVLYPFLLWGMALWAPDVKPPPRGTDDILMELLFALLGLGGFRTFEKIKGVTK